MANDQGMKAFRLYETEQYIVTQVARDMFEGNESQAIRHMIRDYAKRNLVGAPEGNGGQATLVDVRAGYAVQSPKEPA